MKAILQKFIAILVSLVFGHKSRSLTNKEIKIKIKKGDVDIDIESDCLLATTRRQEDESS